MARVWIALVAASAPAAQAQCGPSPPLPPAPKDATEYNGAAWPAGCIDKTQANFFVIGDWGGMRSWGHIKPFMWGRKTINDVDKQAQQLVARAMKNLAATRPPEFVVNVGDNFYPGGIEQTCDSHNPMHDAHHSEQLEHVWKKMYSGSGLDGKQWLGVLGNHDYGGYTYSQGWVQNIMYSWIPNSHWLTPANYWSRRYQFKGFSADFYFVDTNSADVFDPRVEHNICSEAHNRRSCTRNTAGKGPKNCWDCVGFFHRMWAEQKVWLESELSRSRADWQIVVTHFPPETYQEFWAPFAARHGVDLFITGHRHQQEVHYGRPPFGQTAYVVSGGGGGILSEGPSSLSGRDSQYGFMNIEINANTLTIEAHSHGGLESTSIITSTTVVHKRPRAVLTEVV